jgi:hypothetical protein
MTTCNDHFNSIRNEIEKKLKLDENNIKIKDSRNGFNKKN